MWSPRGPRVLPILMTAPVFGADDIPARLERSGSAVVEKRDWT